MARIDRAARRQDAGNEANNHREQSLYSTECPIEKKDENTFDRGGKMIEEETE